VFNKIPHLYGAFKAKLLQDPNWEGGVPSVSRNIMSSKADGDVHNFCMYTV